MHRHLREHQTIRRGGKTYVLVDQAEFERLTGGMVLVPPPTPDSHGMVPAEEYARASIARSIATRRAAAGLSQAKLAELAGVRMETVNRLESAKHIPGVATVAKIDRALTRAGAPDPAARGQRRSPASALASGASNTPRRPPASSPHFRLTGMQSHRSK